MDKKEIKERLHKYFKNLGFEERSGLKLMLPHRDMDYEEEYVEEDVLKFISQELDKAREEGVREGKELYLNAITQTVVSGKDNAKEFYRKDFERVIKKEMKRISKLKQWRYGEHTSRT